MKKIIAMIFILLIGLTILGGCATTKSKTSSEQQQSQQNTNTKPQQDIAKKDIPLPELDELDISFIDLTEFKAKATNLIDPPECNEPSSRSDCITNVAIQNSDIGYCSFAPDFAIASCINDYIKSTGITDMKYCGVGDSSILPTATNNCIFDIALLTQNPDYCFVVDRNKEITSKHDNCLNLIAISKNDLSICEEISEKSRREICIATINRDVEKCVSIQRELPDWIRWWGSSCLGNIAFLKDDLSICEKITDEKFKRYCFASISKDISKCENDEYCINLVAIRLNDLDLCNNIPENSLYKYRCNAVININECDNLKSKLLIPDCKLHVHLLQNGFKVEIDGTILKK